MSGAQSISTRRAYGVQRVCRVWHCARSSVYARRQATPSPAPCRRRGPVGAAPDDVLVAHVRRVLEASPFHGEGYRKVWAKLRVEGRRTSKERVRRLMREHDLQGRGPGIASGWRSRLPQASPWSDWRGRSSGRWVGDGSPADRKSRPVRARRWAGTQPEAPAGRPLTSRPTAFSLPQKKSNWPRSVP